jgi:septal ring factor EnvC (AmiA/AmiB activator)
MSLVALLSLPAILSSITAYLSIILSGIVILSSCYIPYYFDQTKDRRELKKMINLDALDIEIEDRVKQKEELEHDLIKLEKNNDSAKKDIEEIEKKENVLNNELLSIDDDKIELSKDIEQLLIMLVSNSEISEMANKNNAQDNSKVNLGSCKKICL